MSDSQGERTPARRRARQTETRTAGLTNEERDEQQERRGVRGPTSALSSFLRERGIRVPTNPYARISNPATSEQSPEIQTELQTDEAEETVPPIASEVTGEQELQSQAALQRQFPKKHDPDDDSKPKPRKRRQISTLINFCNTCNRRFLTQNTLQCIACTSILPNKKSLQKQQDQVLRITGMLDSKIMSLRDMCLKVLSDNVDLIDSLGFIEPESKTRFARVISKNRKLDANTLELFIGEKEDELRLFDCTLLDQSGLAMIPLQCASLRILDLGLCGRLNDYVLGLIGEKLVNIQVLCFKGAFLCSAAAFSDLFEKLKFLQTVNLEYCVKISDESIESLVKNTNLTSLCLDDLPLITDKGIEKLRNLVSLTELTLNSINCMGSETLKGVIQKFGHILTKLCLNKNAGLTNDCLIDIKTYCTKLEDLSLEKSPELMGDNQLLVDTFTLMKTLKNLSLAGNHTIDDNVVLAICAMKDLECLNINGLYDLTEVSLEGVSKKLKNLVSVDFSWVRSLDDLLFDQIMEGRNLKVVKVFGCHQLSKGILNRECRNSKDERIVILGNEFD